MTVSPTTTVASSTGNVLTFTFTTPNPGLYVSGSELTLAIPSGWTAPSTTSSNNGYTTASAGTGCTLGTLSVLSHNDHSAHNDLRRRRLLHHHLWRERRRHRPEWHGHRHLHDRHPSGFQRDPDRNRDPADGDSAGRRFGWSGHHDGIAHHHCCRVFWQRPHLHVHRSLNRRFRARRVRVDSRHSLRLDGAEHDLFEQRLHHSIGGDRLHARDALGVEPNDHSAHNDLRRRRLLHHHLWRERRRHRPEWHGHRHLHDRHPSGFQRAGGNRDPADGDSAGSRFGWSGHHDGIAHHHCCRALLATSSPSRSPLPQPALSGPEGQS